PLLLRFSFVARDEAIHSNLLKRGSMRPLMSQHQGEGPRAPEPARLRRAKIVCTIGPASDGSDIIRALVDAGMDVARLNFSHGTKADPERGAGLARAASRQRGKPVAILQDLAGPKIRTGTGLPAVIAEGAEVALVEGSAGEGKAIPIEYQGLA